MIRKLLIFYGAGTVGALFLTAIAGITHGSGLLAAIGADFPEPEMPAALYARLVWGGLWGTALILPFFERLPWIQSAVLLGAFPAVAHLLYFFPRMGAGWFGMVYGGAAPLVTIVFCFVWALFATFMVNRARPL